MVSWKWQDVLGFLWGESKRQTELLAQILRSLEAKPTPSSGGKAQELSPDEWVRMTWVEEQAVARSTKHWWVKMWLDDLRERMAKVEKRLAALEAGPQSPPTTAKDTRADRWGVVTESTNQTTPPSSPSGRSTTPTCLVEPGCACALLSHKPPTTLWQSMQIQGKWERVLRVGCPHCDALWAFVQIVARPVPASPSGST